MTKIRKIVSLNDPDYFCNKSWTLSFSFVTNSWISFHSYLPNWYVGENNFFYSGKKGCCDAFDFEVVAGELVPNPPTTTSTTTYPVPISTTSTTTIPFDCVLTGGTFTVLSCLLAGTGIITVGPTPPACTRPATVQSFNLYSGYTTIVPPVVVITTNTEADSCNGKHFVVDNSPNVVLNRMIVWGVSLQPGVTLYQDNGTNNCTPANAGFYYTLGPTEGIYEINSSGTLVAIHPCTITTTTTTTTCNLYIYQVELYICGTCTLTGGGTIGNAQPLVVGKFYFDPVTGFKIKIICDKGCASGTDRNIPSSSAQDNCPAVLCITTPSFPYSFSGPNAVGLDACNDDTFPNTFYSADSSLTANSSILYTDINRTVPVAGNNNWYQQSVVNGAWRIDNTGKVLEFLDCS